MRKKIRGGKYHRQKRDGEKEARIEINEILARHGAEYLPIDEWRALLEAQKTTDREKGRR